jgi:hypothetical protein
VEGLRRAHFRPVAPLSVRIEGWVGGWGREEGTFFSASTSSIRCSYSVFWTGRLVKVEGWGWARLAGGAMAALT